MDRFKALKFEQASENSQSIFKSIKGKVGMLPNLYAAMGISDKLLGGFLTFSETLKKGEFSNKEHEAIALAVAEANACAYCLSAHTAIGKMNGFSDEDTLRLRYTTIKDKKLKALVTLAAQLVEQKGHPSDDTVQDFFTAGYNTAAFAELIGSVALNIITNYMFHNGNYEIDFPLAENLEETNFITQ